MTLAAGIREIVLGRTAAVALVDETDFEWLNAYFWQLDTKGYARRTETMTTGRRRSIAMHRQILGLTPGDDRFGDHINGRPLDNRRSNLRVVTRAENAQNRHCTAAKSGRRHVYWHRPSGLWHVQLVIAGRTISGGYFKEIEDAAAKAASLRRVHMPFAAEAA